MMRVALDSNILIYLAGVGRVAEDRRKIEAVRALIGKLRSTVSLVAPVQTLGETFVVLRRSGVSAAEARTTLLQFGDAFASAPSDKRTVVAAADLAVDHKLQFWDALIVTAAVDAGCVMLLSEDMQHGFVTRGLTIVNPLLAETHPKLATLIG